MFRDRWQSDEPYYALQDVSHENMSITPYARQRWEEIRAYRNERKLYAAIVLPKTFVANLIQLHFRTSKVRSGAKFRFFTSRDDALAWLEWLLESKI